MSGSDRPEPASDFTERSAAGETVSTPATPASAPTPSRNVSARFAPGTVLAGRYAIIRFIAEGGMGAVYEAEDQALQGRVALKTVRPEIGEHPLALERFKREIHVARKITHPNVCRIYDLGIHVWPTQEATGPAPGRLMFLTMEMLAGQTLRELIVSRRRLPIAEAWPIAEQMTAGLEAAHALGIVHRDFKSANVILVPDPRLTVRAVVTDFGLARPVSAEASLLSISATGDVVGTPAYMAPEQMQGRPLTQAADVYALGVVMYEMLTGWRPLSGSPMPVAARPVEETPAALRTLAPELDERWESVILRCIERDPEARFANAAEVSKALRGEPSPTATRVARRAPPSTTGVRRRFGRDRWKAALAAAVVVLAGLAYVALPRRATPPGSSTASAPIVSRRTVGILGFRNVSRAADAAWLSTAISEMLGTDLGAGAKLRILRGEDVVEARRGLGLADDESLSRQDVAILRANLAMDLIVSGAYTLIGPGEGRLLRVDVRLQDAASGETVASGSASGTEGQLFALVSRAAEPLRESLDLGKLSAADTLRIEASLPSEPAAARLYSEGLTRLRLHEALAAREALQEAAALDANHAPTWAALAEAWAALGYDARAAEAATRAAVLARDLPDEDRLMIEARVHAAEKKWGEAVVAYQTVFRRRPDDLDWGIRVAEALTSSGRAREALATAEELRRLPNADSDPRLDLAEARAHQELGDYARQHEIAARAAEKTSQRGARLLLARARLLEANALTAQGNADKAVDAIEEAIKIFEAAGDKGGAAQAVNDMAITVHGSGDLEGARRLYERALAVHRDTGARRHMGLTLANIGLVLYEQGKPVEAAARYEEALRALRQVGARYNEAATLIGLGAQLHVSGELLGAQKRYREALAIFGEIGERDGLATALNNIGEVLALQGNLSEAEKMHGESLAIHRERGNRSSAAYVLCRLGDLLAWRGDLRVARDRYEEALAVQKKLGERTAQAETELSLAVLDLSEGNAAEAEKRARGAEEVLRTSGASDAAVRARALMAETLAAQGRAAEARTALGEAVEAGGTSADLRVRLALDTTALRVAATSGQATSVTRAVADLERTAADAARRGWVPAMLEAQLALGEVEVKARRALGRARLRALAIDARNRGFLAIARRAEAAAA
jgi:tetratricopeptide (TPR) repeat protein/tRNA A-37 threonylcarbamoyl transferase component Bud32